MDMAKVYFHDKKPNSSLMPVYLKELMECSELKAVVAFATKPGIALLRGGLPKDLKNSSRLFFSIREPTDLEAISEFSDDFNGEIYIHLGNEQPCENSDGTKIKGQLHSKIFLFNKANQKYTIILGSANLTGLALYGGNAEAICRITGDLSEKYDETLFKRVQTHINSCEHLVGTERFIKEKLGFYKSLQKEKNNEETLRYEVINNTIMIHAVNRSDKEISSDVIWLYIPLKEADGSIAFFTKCTEMVLRIHEKRINLSFGDFRSGKTYRGPIVMKNILEKGVKKDRAEKRRSTHVIPDLKSPEISETKDEEIPEYTGEKWQTVWRLGREWVDKVHFFQADKGNSKLTARIEWKEKEEEQPMEVNLNQLTKREEEVAREMLKTALGDLEGVSGGRERRGKFPKIVHTRRCRKGLKKLVSVKLAGLHFLKEDDQEQVKNEIRRTVNMINNTGEEIEVRIGDVNKMRDRWMNECVYKVASVFFLEQAEKKKNGKDF